MNYIRLTETGPEYPSSLWQLRLANPNVSFPNDPRAEDLEPFGCYLVEPTPQPEYDPRLEVIEEGLPVQGDEGTWIQTWTIRNATKEEIEEWDKRNRPITQPDWVAFKLLSQSSPEFKKILAQALISDPVNALGIQIELNEVIRGADSRPFYASLTSVFNTVQPDSSITRSFAAAARLMNLPKEFVDLLLSFKFHSKSQHKDPNPVASETLAPEPTTSTSKAKGKSKV